MWSHVKIGLMMVAILAMFATGAMGGIFYEDFDSYATGSQMHGQGGWKGWDNVNTAGALTSADYAVSSPNSVNITSGSDLVHEFDVTGGKIQFTAMQYIPSNFSGSSYFILLSMYNDGGPYDWAVQTHFDSTTNTVVADNSGTSLPLIKGSWVELLFDIDLDANTVDEYYGGELLGSHVWDDDAESSNTLGGIDLYANGATPIYYDNISVDVVPEPASLVLFLGLGLGAVGVYYRRRR